ncbi:MAG: hypothetical protein DRP66_00500 [Planctomycetota bacterium]|nr:MAG: hypothetical protein DRP66_00500 [Planctomycetota bacterium]
MLRNITTLCLFVLILFCIGCSEQTSLNMPDNHTRIAAGYDYSKKPDCFFDRYPENWEHALYHRELTARYEAKELAKK